MSTITYEWINETTTEVDKKYMFIQKIPNTDWIIGSGFYFSDIETKLSKQKINISDSFYAKSKKIIYFAIIVLLLSFFASYYITQKLKESFLEYKASINNKKDEVQELHKTLELKVEQRTIELEKLATTDILTNLHNRYSLMLLFDTEIHRANRYKHPLSVMMLDIDFFKKVNDTYGHDAGDIVLSSFSGLIKDNFRDIDIAGRYGGEEFVIILPNTSLDDAKFLAQRFRKIVSEYAFETVGHITVSIGLVEKHENEFIDALFKRVDKQLYISKNNGRNKVSY